MGIKFEPLEQCAYAVLNIQEEHCNPNCNGYPSECFSYTTIKHLNDFNELFQT